MAQGYVREGPGWPQLRIFSSVECQMYPDLFTYLLICWENVVPIDRGSTTSLGTQPDRILWGQGPAPYHWFLRDKDWASCGHQSPEVFWGNSSITDLKAARGLVGGKLNWMDGGGGWVQRAVSHSGWIR